MVCSDDIAAGLKNSLIKFESRQIRATRISKYILGQHSVQGRLALEKRAMEWLSGAKVSHELNTEFLAYVEGGQLQVLKLSM